MNYDLFISPAAADRYQPVSTSPIRQSGISRLPAGVGTPDPYSEDAALGFPGSTASDQLTTEDIFGSVAAFNEVFEQADVGVRYRIDNSTQDLVITLVDRSTEEIIRQIPPEQILRMRQRLEELMGLIVDTSA